MNYVEHWLVINNSNFSSIVEEVFLIARESFFNLLELLIFFGEYE